MQNKILLVCNSYVSVRPQASDVIMPFRSLGRLASNIIYVLRRWNWTHVFTDRIMLKFDWSTIDMASYDIVIVMDIIKNYHILCNTIERMSRKETRLILYTWNSISYSADYLKISKRWMPCHFSKYDAAATGGVFIAPFYAAPIRRETLPLSLDFFFVGVDKGRLETIESLRSSFDKAGFRHRLVVVNKLKALYNKRYERYYIPYYKVINTINQTKCIVDIVEEGQTGCTQRVMEAIFYGKKLLTNMSCIKEFDFYHKNNIFILGEDNLDTLADFIKRPMYPYPKSILEKYSIDGWLKRIIQTR